MRGSKADLPLALEMDEFIMQEAMWGAMHVEMGTFKKEFDVTPLLKGLPDDLDPTPHWGYLFKGSFRVKYKDHEEVFNAGDVYYMEPGHTAIVEAGTEYLEISPAEQLEKTMAVIVRNLEVMQR